jgi:hypothetical protein
MTNELIDFPDGVYPNIEFEEYKQIKAFNQSGLSNIFDCPARYFFDKHNKKDTPSTRFGRMLHTAVMESEAFDTRYTVMPDFAEQLKGTINPKNGLPYTNIRNTNNYKSLVEKFNAENSDKEIIEFDSYTNMLMLQKMLLLKPETNWLFDYKLQQRELTLVWTDSATGLKCKARIDMLLCRTASFDNGFYICDVKKTLSSNPFKFTNSIEAYGYHIQAAHYLAGAEALGIIESDCDFIHITFEEEAPHLIGCFKMDKATIEAGRQELRKGMEIYKKCLDENTWPGYPDGIKDIGFTTEQLKRSANRVAYN